ncbi:sphingomyelin phosphodiesterase 1 [Manduca sexta]|uniref:sphingomyelin phosphodiesterase 1 n=1 Tax=Manduca sexta TaxID=7130 RepID=UPI00188EFA54|nr:sphingomyelin phosphodiesterase 1 [Manduca sexta]
MKVVVVVFMITLSYSLASQLISFGVVEELFAKFIKNKLTPDETKILQDVFEILHRPEYASMESIERNSESRMSIECLVCRSTFASAIQGLNEGQTDEEIIHVVTTLCVSLGIQNYNICSGAIALNLPIITYIVRNEPAATAATFCGFLFQTVHNSNTCPFHDTRFDWQVELPERPTEVATPALDSKPLTIAIITDAHIDPLYEAFGVADCDEPTCCRVGQNPARNYKYVSNVEESIIEQSIVNNNGDLSLDLGMVPKIKEMRKTSQTRFSPRNSPPAGYWGDYRNCDSPIWAFDDVIDRIVETHKNVDVVYYIGDTIDHGVWETTYELINDMNRYLIDKIRKSFGDDVLVVPVLGNHESQPTNQFAPSSVKEPYLNTTWLYDALAEKWDFYLTDKAKEALKERGEFSIQVRPGLRAINLNNNVAYRSNWWLVYDPLDAKRHLDWLVQELYEAEKAGDKVHILAHIPPGVHDLTYTWTREYNRIVNRFSSTIAAEFNGHTHSDEFKIFYDSEGTPINVAWGGGSATAYSFYNLNYKIATIDTQTFMPTNIINYAYNLTEANLTPNRRPHWFQLYDMKNAFGLIDLSPSSMDNLVHRMVTTNKELLDKYAAFYSKLSDSRWPYCNTNCKLDNLCKTVVTILWERERCEKLRSLYFQ